MKFTLNNYEDLKTRVGNMSVESLLKTVCCPDMIPASNKECYTECVGHYLASGAKEDNKRLADKIYSEFSERLITADFENGAGAGIKGATRFPEMMAFGEVDDTNLAYKMGEICAAEARPLGYTWTLAPCVDLAINKLNPIVNLRCQGDDVEKAIRIGGAYMRGLQDNGIIATLKHFPGDGVGFYDQHLTVGENTLTKNEWDNTYGKIYKTLINEGAMAVMPGHISLGSYDEIDEKMDMYPPATLSKNLLTCLLKNQLGFEGIIVSDALNMGGHCGYINFYDGCCRFLESGGDCLLFVHPSKEFLQEMTARVENGLLCVETLKNRAYRMLCFARQYHENLKPIPVVSSYDAKKVSDEVVEKACKIIRDRNNIVPFNIKKDTKILHLAIHNNYHKNDVDSITTELKKLADAVTFMEDPGPGKILSEIKNGNYDLVVCTIGCWLSYGTNAIKLYGPTARNMMNGWTKMGVPVVFVNYGNPWLSDEYKATIDTLINTYGCTDHTAEAVIKTIIKK